MLEARVMGGLMATFGALLLLGCLLRWPWFVEGRRFRVMQQIHPRAPFVFYGLMGAALFVFGVLGALGIWRGALDFGGPG